MTNLYSYRLDLPFTSPPMRDNDRYSHWAVKARATRELRDTAHLLAKAAKLPVGLEHVEIVLHWQPGTSRGRDALSAAPTLKALVDGLVTDYGLTRDDTIRHVRPWCAVYSWVRGKPAACWLTIQETPGTEVAA